MESVARDGRSGAVAFRAKVARVAVAVVMALALVPAVSVEQALAAQPTFVGSVYYPVQYDENGFPLYNEDGTFQRGNPYVMLENVENASGTLVIPAAFDVVVREGGAERVERNVTPAILQFGESYTNSWINSAVTSIDVRQCASVERTRFEGLSSIESVDLQNLPNLREVAYSDCAVLYSVNTNGCSPIKEYRLNNCENLPIPDFSQQQWSELSSLHVSDRNDFTSLPTANLKKLTELSIQNTGLDSIDLSPCTELDRTTIMNNSRLTELDAASVPASVAHFDCRYNQISDTAALVERFGERNVLPQSYNSREVGLHVVNERIAQGTILPGDNYSFGLDGAYRPSDEKLHSYWQEDYAARNALANFSASSSDAAIATVEITDELGPRQLRVDALKVGTTTLTVNYAFTGAHGTYTGQQVIDFTVAASANPIVSVSCAPSVDVPFVSKCALCGESHESVDGGIMVPIEITAQDADRLPSASAHVEVASADQGIVYGGFQIEPDGIDSEYAIRLNPHGLGSTTVTLTGVTSVNGQEVRTDPVTVQVNVVESPKPTLSVSDTFVTTSLTQYHEGGASNLYTVVSPGAYERQTSIASYVEDDALAQITNRHGNYFAHGHPTGSAGGSEYPAVYTATSDNEAVVSVVSDANRGLCLQMNSYGTARIAIKDVWGNEGTCTVTVKDRVSELTKLSLSQDELTVKAGQTFDLSTLVQGMSDLDLPYPPRLVFKTGNGYFASVKQVDDGSYNYCILRGQNVGDVTVTAGVLTGNDMGGSLDYIDQWETTDFGTLTVHVVSADTPTNPATAVEVTGASHTLEMGSALQLSASITPVDADNADTLAWSSSDEDIATVDASGKVVPVAPGPAVITATVGAVSGTFEVTVVEHAIPATAVTISTADDAMEVGDTQRLAATVEPANSTDAVEWFSADEKVLTVDQSGLVTAVGNGTTAIGVRAGAVKDETRAITVTTPVSGVSLDKQALELYVGAGASRLVATVAPATASDQSVSWRSSDPSVAAVDGSGNVAPVATGSATVTATTGDGAFEATCEVTVKQHAEGIALDAHELTLIGAQTAPLKATISPDNATNKGVTWTSSDEGVATVDADGNVSAAGKGTATVTATTEDGGHTDTCAVTVKNPATRLALDPSALALIKGDSARVSSVLSGELEGEVDEIGTVSWASSDESVATVADGAVAAVATGAATITAEATVGAAKLTGTCTVTVTNPVQSVAISEASRTATVGDDAFTLSATVSPADADDPTVAWSSSNPRVAAVHENGAVTVLSAGTASIVASAGGKSAACALTVKAKEIAQTPQGSGFTASVTATDSETVKALERLAGDGGLNLVVDGIAQLTASAKEAVEKLTADGAMVADAFDIHFTDDRGQEIVLSKDDGGRVVLTVRVKLTDSMRSLLDQGMRLQVHYVGEDGTVEDKETWLEGDYLCFTTEHFSNYVVTGVPTSGEPASDGPRPLAAADGGSSLAPTGDPTRPAALAIGALASLAAAAAVRVRRKTR